MGVERPLVHNRRARVGRLALLLGLGLLTLVFFSKILLTNLILTGVDVFTYFYPYRDYAAEALRQARLPLWNPYLFLGVPFLANSQAAVFYPLHWPLAWLPVPRQIALSIALHVWPGGPGLALLEGQLWGLYGEERERALGSALASAKVLPSSSLRNTGS